MAEGRKLTIAKDNKFPTLTEDKENSWEGNFIFIQAADTQFGLIDQAKTGSLKTNVWDDEIALTKIAIEKANQLVPRPRFFIVCGDLVNAFPSARYRDDQVKTFKDLFAQLHSDVPLVCVCGNHDVGDTPTRESVVEYRNNFGDDYFTFWKGGVFFIVLNSQYFKDASKVPEEYDKHSEWLEKQLQIAKLKKCVHAVVFQHIPWFFNTPDEDDNYFNIEKETQLKMLNKFKAAGIKKVFCGHYHRNAGGHYESLEVVVTSAVGFQLGDDYHGMRIVKITKDNIEHKYYNLDESFPTNINLSEDLP